MTDKPELPAVDSESPDPFDPETLRLSQDFAQLADVKPILATVPVRKPGRQDFVRVNVDPDYQLTTAILQLKEEREDYIVAPDIRQELFGELVPVTLFTAINRQGVVFLWPCRIPDETGRANSWHESALEAVASTRTTTVFATLTTIVPPTRIPARKTATVMVWVTSARWLAIPILTAMSIVMTFVQS